MFEEKTPPLSLKENMEREAKEAACRRRIQELEEQKRHSWAGGEAVRGPTYQMLTKCTKNFK